MVAVDVHEAKTNLSRLLDRVAAGEEIVIAKAGKPIAKLVPFNKPPKRRTLGQDEGCVRIADDFSAPLHEEIQKLFE